MANIGVSQAVAYAVLGPGYSDGASTGGLSFGGSDTPEIHIVVDASRGGLAFSGDEIFATERTDNVLGGLTFGGDVHETWSNPWSVAVTGGTYRINGTIYTLPNIMYYAGLGDIAATVRVATPPSTTGYFRYDVLEIGTDQAIHVIAGTEGYIPAIPNTTASHDLINYILRYEGQLKINQYDIGRLFTTPIVSTVTVTASDSELSWAELTSTLTVNIYNQYGQLYRSSAILIPSFLDGNGTVSPASRSTTTGTTTFTYTRDQIDPGDESPIIKVSASSGAYGIVPITLLDAGGSPMF